MQGLDPEDVEKQYLESPFVKEICVFHLSDENPPPDRLFAVVVPNLELTRRRRIVNVGDLLRFEIEGQSVHLPSDKKIRGFDISFVPLPRSASGLLDRAGVERAYHDRRRQAETRRKASTEWARWNHAPTVVDAITRRTEARVIWPDANIELDLGLDSLARVELLAELEHRCGLRMQPVRGEYVLTVSELLDALEPTTSSVDHTRLRSARIEAELRRGRPLKSEPWAVVLRAAGEEADQFRVLFERHVLKGALYGFLRMLRLLIPSIEVRGLEHVPTRGPFIVAPNHQSYLDPFFVCSVLPYRVVRDVFAVAAAEYIESPLVIWTARQLNLVRVDPDANLVPAMKAAAFGLTQGKTLILFPEGERSIDGSVKRFKKGASILSRHLGVPIVPVAIRGAFDIWPRNRPFNWRVLLPWSGHHVEISFGRPMLADDGLSYTAAAAALERQVDDMWRPVSP